MAGRTFAQINCSILQSRKIGKLAHADRWTYLCAHFTPLSSFSGVFHYPAVMWAHDSNQEMSSWLQSIENICDSRLVEWDNEEELVRIIGFHRQRPPDNASRVISHISDFEILLDRQRQASGMVLRTAAEFVVAAVSRAQSWKPESPDIPKLRDALGRFLRASYQEFDQALIDALETEMNRANKATRAEIGALLPPVTLKLSDTVSTPCKDPVPIRDEDKTKENKDKINDEKQDATTSLRAHDDRSERLFNETHSQTVNEAQNGPRESTKRSPLVKSIQHDALKKR